MYEVAVAVAIAIAIAVTEESVLIPHLVSLRRGYLSTSARKRRSKRAAALGPGPFTV